MSMLATRENTLSHITRIFGRQLGHRWQPGDRLPPVRDLAQEMGVSHGTIYRALQQMVRKGYLVAKPRQGLYVSQSYEDSAFRSEFLKDKPPADDFAAMDLTGRRVTLYYSHESTHMVDARSAIESQLSLRGCVVTQLPYQNDPPDPQGQDCTILINPSPLWKLKATSHQPVIVVTSAATSPLVVGEHWDFIGPDQEQGAMLAGMHLHELGCKDVCFVGLTARANDTASIYETTSSARLRGLSLGWGEPLKPENLLRSHVYSPIGGAQAAKTFAALAHRPDGVFAGTDELAMGFISGAEALGLRLGRDYQLVGFDGQPQLDRLDAHGVSSVVVPARWMGQTAVQLLVQRWAHPTLPSRRMLLGCTLRKTHQTDSSL